MTMATRPRPAASALSRALDELSPLFGDRLSTALPLRRQHANTTTWIAPEPPDAVAFPHAAEEVQQAVRICARHRLPVIAFGAGSSFEGHVNAPQGGLCLDLTHMDQVLAVHPQDFSCTVQPGITRRRLEAELRGHGLYFPVDPGADATLGGMASTRASGTTALRHGTMKANVLALTAVLPDGELVRTGSRAPKSAAGYDLTGLFVGAEGTLGIITELTLRLQGIPEAISAGVCSFPSTAAACEAAVEAIQCGIPLARIEFVDEVQIAICNAYSKLALRAAPHLFVEFHGSTAGVTEQSELFGDIAAGHGAGRFDWALRTEDRNRLWRARHDVFWASKAHRAGASVIVTDVCVPISQLARCLTETRADIDRSGLTAPIVGHLGDGNFHAMLLVDMADAEEVARARGLLDRLAGRALEMGGTCTGEHGIGAGKRKFLEAEHGARAVALMRALKRAVDPQGIMNPGKIV